MTSGPVGLRCPYCGKPPIFVFNGGRQAFCGTLTCSVMTWNPIKTREQLEAGRSEIDLRGI